MRPSPSDYTAPPGAMESAQDATGNSGHGTPSVGSATLSAEQIHRLQGTQVTGSNTQLFPVQMPRGAAQPAMPNGNNQCRDSYPIEVDIWPPGRDETSRTEGRDNSFSPNSLGATALPLMSQRTSNITTPGDSQKPAFLSPSFEPGELCRPGRQSSTVQYFGPRSGRNSPLPDSTLGSTHFDAGDSTGGGAPNVMDTKCVGSWCPEEQDVNIIRTLSGESILRSDTE